MTQEMTNKISCFIDDLLEHRLDLLTLDFFISKKKRNYSIEIDTGVSCKPMVNIGIIFGTQKVYFSVCEDGGMVLSRQDYDVFSDNDSVFAKKYFDKLQIAYTQRQIEIVDNIIDSSYSDLKLRRDSNIDKLIC